MGRVFGMSFGQLYPLYRARVERKGRRPEELDGVLGWLIGMEEAELRCQVEQVEDPLMRRIRVMDKLVDELAKGRKLEMVLRG